MPYSVGRNAAVEGRGDTLFRHFSRVAHYFHPEAVALSFHHPSQRSNGFTPQDLQPPFYGAVIFKVTQRGGLALKSIFSEGTTAVCTGDDDFEAYGCNVFINTVS